MRLTKMALVAAACTVMLAGCGSQTLTPTSAENQALSKVPGAKHVITYPLLFPLAAKYLPTQNARRVGSPAYIFAMDFGKKVAWAASGSRGAAVLIVYPSLEALSQASSKFNLSAAARRDLKALGTGPYHKIPLSIIGIGTSSISGKTLVAHGISVAKSGNYLVLGVATLPAQLHGGTLGIANFVFSGSTMAGEYGTIP